MPRTVVEQVERGLYYGLVLVWGKLMVREECDGMEEWEKPRHLTKAMLDRFTST